VSAGPLVVLALVVLAGVLLIAIARLIAILLVLARLMLVLLAVFTIGLATLVVVAAAMLHVGSGGPSGTPSPTMHPAPVTTATNSAPRAKRSLPARRRVAPSPRAGGVSHPRRLSQAHGVRAYPGTLATEALLRLGQPYRAARPAWS
jgi:hypothetical protein